MKIKIGTQLEEEVLHDLKVRAARERRPMGEIIQEAVVGYLANDRTEEDEKERSLLRILDNPARLSDEAFAELVEADFYDQSA